MKRRRSKSKVSPLYALAGAAVPAAGIVVSHEAMNVEGLAISLVGGTVIGAGAAIYGAVTKNRKALFLGAGAVVGALGTIFALRSTLGPTETKQT